MSPKLMELGLGAAVTIRGVVVAQTRFNNGEITYSVQYERKGRTVSEWFALQDLITDDEQDGGGI